MLVSEADLHGQLSLNSSLRKSSFTSKGFCHASASAYPQAAPESLSPESSLHSDSRGRLSHSSATRANSPLKGPRSHKLTQRYHPYRASPARAAKAILGVHQHPLILYGPSSGMCK